jgi:hypothetical protein
VGGVEALVGFFTPQGLVIDLAISSWQVWLTRHPQWMETNALSLGSDVLRGGVEELIGFEHRPDMSSILQSPAVVSMNLES